MKSPFTLIVLLVMIAWSSCVSKPVVKFMGQLSMMMNGELV